MHPASKLCDDTSQLESSLLQGAAAARRDDAVAQDVHRAGDEDHEVHGLAVAAVRLAAVLDHVVEGGENGGVQLEGAHLVEGVQREELVGAEDDAEHGDEGQQLRVGAGDGGLSLLVRDLDDLLADLAGLRGAGVLLGDVGQDAAGHDVEPLVQAAGGLGVQDELRGHALADLHHAREHLGVVVQVRQRRDRHHLRDRAEAEHLLCVQQTHELQRLGRAGEGISDHVVQARQRLAAVLGLRELTKVVGLGVLLPDGLGPEGAAVDIVLQVVADDVGLLQEHARGVGDGLGHLLHLSGLVARAGEQAGQTLAHEARDVVAVEVVGGDVHGALSQVLLHVRGHAGAHALRNVSDDFLGGGGEGLEDSHTLAVVLQQRALVAQAHAIHVPAVRDQAHLVELVEVLDLHAVVGLEELHVVLDGVQGTQGQVEDKDVHAQALGQLVDHRRERATHLVEHVVAKLHVVVLEVDLVGHRAAAVLQPQRREHLVDVGSKRWMVFTST
eukprot:Colp12_sorted_trinity150504_noHs@30891